jgi:hypothetical protein
MGSKTRVKLSFEDDGQTLISGTAEAMEVTEIEPAGVEATHNNPIKP